MIRICYYLLISIYSFLWACNVQASVPITTDSRIKTFIYNENEVFPITVHYGYMTSIEFAKNEIIQTIAPGNGYSWKFIQDNRRLFIKALEGAAHTNMTIITSKRTYQFELQSRNPKDILDEQLVYVVRFFYPDQLLDQPPTQVDTQQFLPNTTTPEPSPIGYQQPFEQPEVITQKPDPKQALNFDYSLSGSDKIAPIRVYDDGKSTFIQFANNNAAIPQFYIQDTNGKEVRSSYSRKGDYIVISKVTPEMVLRLGSDEVRLYNEQYQ